MKPNIFLIGFMGTGKTTIGRILAAKARMDFIDLDRKIEERTGQQISALFESNGEVWFRKLETRILSEFVTLSNKVFSTGGGIVLNPNNLEMMKQNGIVIGLEANVDTLWERLQDKTDRPLLKDENPREALNRLYQQRTGLYDNVHFSIEVDGKQPIELVEEICSFIRV